MDVVTFAAQAAALLATSLAVVATRSPLRSALALVLVQVQLAVLYVGLKAPFVATMQVLVYAGAVMVLFVFVIMLLNLEPEVRARATQVPWLKWAGAGASLAVMLGIAVSARQLAGPLVGPVLASSGPSTFTAGVHEVGEVLLGRFMFAFEATSVLLLVSVVGAVVLGLKRLTP